MNKLQLDEFLRLDMHIDNEYDLIRQNANKQFRLRNEILQIGHNTENKEKKILELKQQQYRLKGRAWIESEVKEIKNG